MKQFKSFLYLLLFYSCTNQVFKSEIPAWLNIEDVEISNSKTFDEYGGFGEGITIEIYTLSLKTIQVFEKNKNIILPEKIGWSKFNWMKTNSNSMLQKIDFIFNYHGENNYINNNIQQIKTLSLDRNSYVALYYNGNDIKKAHKFLVLLLNTVECNLYIYEFIM